MCEKSDPNAVSCEKFHPADFAISAPHFFNLRNLRNLRIENDEAKRQP